MKITVESPFYRDELIRMLYDLSNPADKNMHISDIGEMLDSINKKKDGAGWKHIFITVRVKSTTGGENMIGLPDNMGMLVTRVDDHEKVVTMSLFSWCSFARIKRSGALYQFMKKWLNDELAGIEWRAIF